jgi:hypothetical protein
MSCDQTPAGGPAQRGPSVPFSAELAREICRRTAAGETVASICADAHMPAPSTLWRWAKKRPAFGRILARARAMGEREGPGRARRFCPATAHEIVVRVSEGEALSAIAQDPAMPSLRTIFRWRAAEAEFAEDLALAKTAMAERFADLGWAMALDATPATAHLTRVRLGQLRWTCAVLSPATHGKLKAADPPAPPEVTNVALTTFQTEVNPETGQVRAVAMHYSPETGEITRRVSQDWRDPPFPLVKEVDYVTAKTVRVERGMNVDNPARWDLRPSAKDDPQA